eukprot:273928-Alexandrium_andersonii.AAC.1
MSPAASSACSTSASCMAWLPGPARALHPRDKGRDAATPQRSAGGSGTSTATGRFAAGGARRKARGAGPA